MKELGYATAAAGKWQITDFRIEPEAMKKHGFDDWAMCIKVESSPMKSMQRNQPGVTGTHTFIPRKARKHIKGNMVLSTQRPHDSIYA